MPLLVLSVAAALVVVAGPVRAEAEPDPAPPLEPMVTDRPTDSAAPVVVPRGTLQFEFGYKWTRIDDASGRINSHLFPDLLMRYGISDTVEARLVAAGWTIERGDTAGSEGFNDISLGAKFALAEERGRRPQMALLVDVSLPSGDEKFTNDEVIPKVLFLGANTLSDRLAVTYNVGPSLVTTTTDGESETHLDLNYAVALGFATHGSASLFAEIFGAFASGPGFDDRHNIQVGTTILLGPRFQIDFRGGAGLVDNEPDWFVGTGLAFRVPR